ncbi:hypothetical protein HFO10_00700 [Rhizobium laguerreae]|uniref:AAA family ATPase n=1 Tax=Rhizobium laguerreae TaxID=1076926 RepID=UPI001C905FB3|nr:AAA family ATPase [Rhizobium laguerreae]MBY3294491.1 hypothetical protein [Rhizobium laguerreae]
MHEFLPPEIIADERLTISAKPHYAAQAPDFPLNLLSDRQFEILVYDLLQAERPSTRSYDCVSILGYGADKGRDIILYKKGKVSRVVQCKRYASNIGIGTYVAELCKLIMFSLRDEKVLGVTPAGHYELWTSSGVTEELRSFIVGEDAYSAPEGLISEAVLKVRRGYKILQSPPRDKTEEQEVEAVVSAFARLTFSHVGANDINQRLARQSGVAKWFFRGPDDMGARASIVEIGTLADGLRSQQLLALKKCDSDDLPYLDRKSLGEAYKQFLEAGAKAMVLVGGSGYGKTTWLSKLLEQSSAASPVILIQADDIVESDLSVVSTLSRQLRGGRLKTVPSQDLEQALWDWIDSANLIVLIDGLDRAPSQAQASLHRWLLRTVNLCREAPVRFIITSRPETWAVLWPELDQIKSMLFQPRSNNGIEASPGSISINPLDWSEAKLLYRAYGMDIRRHGIHYLRTPSMIANASRMHLDGSLGVHPPSRLAILKARVEEAVKDVGRRAGIGPAAANRVLGILGQLIARTEDGRVNLAELPDSGTAEVLDEFARSDLVRIHGSIVRPEMDEVIEYLWASSSSFESLFEACKAKDASPLMIGALSLSVALLEQEGTAAFHEAVVTLVEQSRNNPAIFEATARALAESRDAPWLKQEIGKLVSQWDRPNLFLPSSNFGQLVHHSRLSPFDHLEVIFALAEHEELDDWRTKYVLDGVFGRFSSLFAHSSEECVRRSGPEIIGLLADEFDRSEKRAAVARYLIYVAFTALPAEQLGILWTSQRLRSFHYELTTHFPRKMEAALHIHLLHSPAPTAENILHLYLTARSLYEKESPPEDLEQVAGRAASFLPDAPHPTLRIKLLLCMAMHQPDVALQKQIFESCDTLEPNDLWLAIGLMGEYRKQMISKLFADNGTGRPHGQALANVGIFPERAIPVELWPYFSERTIESVAVADDQSGRNIALALEILLYSAQSVDDLMLLKPAAVAISGSLEAELRRPLTYYAGSPSRSVNNEEITQFRDELFWELVRAEDGSNLQVLGWKILQSAHERSDAWKKLWFLIERFGRDKVMAELSPYDQIEPNAKWVLQQLPCS